MCKPGQPCPGAEDILGDLPEGATAVSLGKGKAGLLALLGIIGALSGEKGNDKDSDLEKAIDGIRFAAWADKTRSMVVSLYPQVKDEPGRNGEIAAVDNDLFRKLWDDNLDPRAAAWAYLAQYHPDGKPDMGPRPSYLTAEHAEMVDMFTNKQHAWMDRILEIYSNSVKKAEGHMPHGLIDYKAILEVEKLGLSDEDAAEWYGKHRALDFGTVEMRQGEANRLGCTLAELEEEMGLPAELRSAELEEAVDALVKDPAKDPAEEGTGLGY